MMLRPILPLVVLAGFAFALLVAGLVHGWRAKGRSARIAGWLRVVLALLAIGIALRPVQGHFEPRPAESRSDVLLMIDRTTSMGATDYAGGASRMAGVAADVAELMQQVAGARVAVIVIDDEAQLAVPFTTDAAAVTGFVGSVGWRNAKTAAGSDISVGVDLARET
ncbi:MAG: VWA domain-containing protein, partial [Propionibacteriaceae bacterium]|nr:VWA domain-containing protein [Propionibacteriaceae bacterium]